LQVVAKSNRLKVLLCKSMSDPNASVCGSKFFGEERLQHVFTYYIKLEVLRDTISKLEKCITIVDTEFNGTIKWENIELFNKDHSKYTGKTITRTTFAKAIIDAYYVEKFNIDQSIELGEETSIVTIYKTDVKTADLLNSLGIDTTKTKTLDETTILLPPNELRLLKDKAPYLIAMKHMTLEK